MKGSFFTSRDIFSHEVWKHPLDFRLFFLIYGSATFLDEYEHAGLILKRGQWIRSFRNLQKDLEYQENNKMIKPSLSSLKKAIERLKTQGMIETESKQAGTIFSVINYDKYQTQRNRERHREHQKPGAVNTWDEPQTVDTIAFFEQKTGSREHQKRGTVNGAVNNNNNVLKNNGLLEVEEGSQAPSLYDEFYSSYGKQPTPIQIQTINSFLSGGMERSAIQYAIEKASLASNNFNYLNAILKNWSKDGIKNIDQAKKKEQNHKKKGTSHNEKRSQGKFEHNYEEYDVGF